MNTQKIDPMHPPSQVPPVAHDQYRRIAREIMEQNPGMPASMIQRLALARLQDDAGDAVAKSLFIQR